MEEGDETTAEEEYLFSDTLGSISAVANAMGGVSERHRYDPWGRPRATVDWSAITDGTWFAMNREETATSKGFTGHEMLDQVGIVHMGGRIYDPTLGRFMSADPVVKGLDNTESYNRYSYVRNSPMSYTDPSGYSWISDAWDDITDFVKDHILEVAVAIVSPQVGLLGAMAAGYGGRELAQFEARNQYGGEVLGLIGTAVCSFATGGTGAAGCVTKFQGFSSMAIAHENGASIGQSLVAGVSSAALAGANIGIAGKIAGTGSNFAVSGALHGMRGGILAGLSGSDARSGLIGGATEGMFGDWIQDWADNDTPGGTVMAGFLSGSVSQVTGGKFAVGAATGAMGYLFNQAREGAFRREKALQETKVQLGDKLFSKYKYHCATAWCAAMEANVPLDYPGNAAYVAELDARAVEAGKFAIFTVAPMTRASSAAAELYSLYEVYEGGLPGFGVFMAGKAAGASAALRYGPRSGSAVGAGSSIFLNEAWNYEERSRE